VPEALYDWIAEADLASSAPNATVGLAVSSLSGREGKGHVGRWGDDDSR